MGKDEGVGQTKHEKLTRVNTLVAKSGGHHKNKTPNQSQA